MATEEQREAGRTEPAETDHGGPLVSVEGLTKHFEVGGGFFKSSDTLKAVDGVSFDLHEGEVLGLAGESGCGKSTTALTLSRLITPTDGNVSIDGVNYDEIAEDELRRTVQYIFQDPYGSVNPTQRIRDIVAEAPRNLLDLSEAELTERAHETLDRVGLDPEEFAGKYPHELSGGELQRVSIAAALSVEPEVIVADEPTSMLDASNRGRVLSILKDILQERELSVIYISHNLGVLRQISDRIAIMYLGRIVEVGETDRIVADPNHPYTAALQSASLVLDPTEGLPDIDIQDEVQKPIDLPTGCNFQDRCPHKGDRCTEDPSLQPMGPGQEAACFYPVGNGGDP